MTALLEIEGLTKSFGGLKALSEVNLAVERGQIVSVIGPNGAGKTTLFNMICQLYSADGGQMRFEGRPLQRRQPHQLAGLGIGRTFQNLALFRHGTVIDNLLVGMHAHLRSGVLSGMFFGGPARREEIAARERAEEVIDFLNIEELRDTPVSALPYGLRKRVELGRALCTRPKLLLLDEMVSGMNREETEDIARFVLDLRDELGITVLMIEHEMRIVMDISDRVLVLNFGTPIAFGTPAEVSADPAVIAAYLGGAKA